MTTYFGFAIADGMFPSDCIVQRFSLTVEEVVEEINSSNIVPILNPSHEATVVAMRDRFGINIEIPSNPPKVSLQEEDIVIVMSVRNLPRMTDNRHYTQEEVDKATFVFGKWIVK